MSEKLQWFKFYATDWLSDARVRLMTSRQRGWYIDLLCWAWQEYGFEPEAAEIICQVFRDRQDVELWIDEDDNRRAQLNITAELATVLSCFTTCLDGSKISHPRLEELRKEILFKSEKQSLAGMETQKKLAAKHKSKQALRASGSGSSSVVVSEEKNSLPNKPPASELCPEVPPRGNARWQNDAGFIEFVDAYRAIGGPLTDADCVSAYFIWPKLDFIQKRAAFEHIQTCEGAHVKLIHNYLEAREWTRPARPAPKSKLERMMDAI